MPDDDQHAPKDRPSIALAMNTRNEEGHIAEALASAAGVDEIVVADMQSTDRTVEICRKAGARVFSVPDYGYCEPARQALVDAPTTDWILVLDADERLSQNGVDTLRQVASAASPEVAAFLLPTRTFLGSVEVKGTGWSIEEERHPRFFRRGSVTWPARIHSVPTFTGTVRDLPTGKEVVLYHKCFDHLTDAWHKFITYSAVEASYLHNHNQNSTWVEGLRESIDEMLRRYQPEVDGGVSYALSFAIFFYRLAVHLRNIELSGTLPEEPVPSRQSLASAWRAFLVHLTYNELKRYLSHFDDMLGNLDKQPQLMLAIASRASALLEVAPEILPDNLKLPEIQHFLTRLKEEYCSLQSELEDMKARLTCAEAKYDDALARLRTERDLSADLYRHLNRLRTSLPIRLWSNYASFRDAMMPNGSRRRNIYNSLANALLKLL